MVSLVNGRSCGDYFQTSAFGDCVKANVQCDCPRVPISSTEPVFWLLAMFLLFMAVCCCMCCRNFSRLSTSNNRSHPVVARPVVSSEGRSTSAGMMGNGINSSYAARTQVPTYATQHSYAPQTHLTTFIAATPQKRESPPPEEYSQPPSYYECVSSSSPPHGCRDTTNENTHTCTNDYP
ncbi:hypothetical protein Ocin01_11559 [Orchesella cincta]|uniref:Uncharacterized protein n=1 Tax=Orchesella cincta TaxID=48709 RepID=A0A1D2MQQ3_ORCCI|nr:hypothetical protein Ocin01_11559 [Orchesella cincta]